MIIKTIKKHHQFPYKQYTSKLRRHKFEAHIFEDNGGQLVAKIGREMTICREDAKLEDWLDDAEEMYNFYHNLVDFLKEVNFLRKEELSKKEKC